MLNYKVSLMITRNVIRVHLQCKMDHWSSEVMRVRMMKVKVDMRREKEWASIRRCITKSNLERVAMNRAVVQGKIAQVKLWIKK